MEKVVLLKQYGFFLELLFAMVVLMLNNKKRKYFWLGLAIIAIGAFPIYWMPKVGNLTIDLAYLVEMLILFCCSFALYKEKPLTLLFGSISAFALQHLTWNTFWLFFSLFPDSLLWPTWGIQLFFWGSHALIYALFLLVFWKLKIPLVFSEKEVGTYVISAVIIIVVLVLSQLIPLNEWNPIYRIYTSLCVFLALVIEVGYPYLMNLNSKSLELSKEKEALEKMLKVQAYQQSLSKETTSIINLKFHDMKNQLSSLRELHGEQRQQSIDELEKSIDIYGDIAKTGNEAIDIVVTQKSLLCSSKKIRFTYIIDGKSFNFLSSTDITSLFGNIIDNAIEAVDKEEEDYRLIKLTAFNKSNFIQIVEENYSHNDLSFFDGMPVSTKKDSINHGFGLKSIQYLVQKYQGDVKITKDDNVFRIFILIPVPSNAK